MSHIKCHMAQVKFFLLLLSLKELADSFQQLQTKAIMKIAKVLENGEIQSARVKLPYKGLQFRRVYNWPWLKNAYQKESQTHSYWHGAKNISKSLAKDELLKSCDLIKDWHGSIMRQWWWALQSSVGNAALAREKIMSIFSHISGHSINII